MNDNFVEDILSSETKANETSASVLNQMRNGPIPRHKTDTALLTHFADRLEKTIQKEVQEAAMENAILPAVDVSKTIPDKDIRVSRAMAQTVSAIEAIIQAYDVIDQEPSLRANLESIIKNIEDALSVAERTERMLNEAISLLTNSQYIIGNLMAHSNLSGSKIGNEIRKLKREIADFLNSVP